MKSVLSVYLNNVSTPLKNLSDCQSCGQDKSLEKYEEQVTGGYVWSTHCHACQDDDSGYEF